MSLLQKLMLPLLSLWRHSTQALEAGTSVHLSYQTAGTKDLSISSVDCRFPTEGGTGAIWKAVARLLPQEKMVSFGSWQLGEFAQH